MNAISLKYLSRNQHRFDLMNKKLKFPVIQQGYLIKIQTRNCLILFSMHGWLLINWVVVCPI